MNFSALLALACAFQAAGQQQPPTNPPQSQSQIQALPPSAAKQGPPVSAELPFKFTAQAPAAGQAVAKVDGQSVYGRDVENLLWESLGPQMVEDVITLVEVRRAAAAQNITLSQAEVEKRLKEDLVIYEQRTRTGQQARPQGMSPEDYLAGQGFPKSRLYLNTEIEVFLDKMAEKLFKPDHYVKVSLMIFRAADNTDAAGATALKNANDAEAKLKKGDKWETVIQSSQLPAQYLKTNGLIGWLDYNTFPPDVLTQMKGLKAGDISQPIKIASQPSQQTGGQTPPTVYQIFRVEALSTQASAEDLTQLRQRFVQEQHATLLKSIREAAKVERFPTKEPNTGTAAAPVK